MDAVQSFEYAEASDAPFVPAWSEWEFGERAGCGSVAGRENVSAVLEEEKQRAHEAGRARGFEEGRNAERAAHAHSLVAAEGEKIRRAGELAAQFEAERARYFQAAEQQVVKLAVAIAGRILRREAQSDPLLLMGAVRVALGQTAASAEVRLRVPAGELELWTEAIALLPNLHAKPQVIAGEGLRPGECRMETSLGSADLSVPRQLAEIERALLADDSAARE